MPSHIHLFTPGASVTYMADADITGGRLVEISGDLAVTTADADSASVVGAAAVDTKAGQPVTVLAGGVQALVATGAITAGDRVAAAADGTVATAAEGGIGLAIKGAAAGALADIQLD